MRFARWTFGITLVAGPLVGGLSLIAAPTNGPTSLPATRPEEGHSLVAGLIENIVREQLKAEYVDDDDWGQTRKVTVGYKLRGKPFAWDLKRRTKIVKDGLWEMYRVRLVDPEENLQIQVSRLEMQGGRMGFGLSLTAKLAGDARLERWRKGIKMLNAHVEAKGTVEVFVAGDIGIQLESGGVLPSIALEPSITKVQLKLLKFDLQRISKLEGQAAHELGDSLKDTIQRELNRREPKIVARLNQSITRRKDQLRLSPDQFARTGWANLRESLND